MSIKFAIKDIAGDPVREGDQVVRFTGSSEPFRRSSERTARKIGGTKENPILQFNTGLNTSVIDFATWLSDEEKKEIKEQIASHRDDIKQYYGGEEALNESNPYFWGRENLTVNKLTVDNTTQSLAFDTKNPEHALLYFSIVAGAFGDLVAPSKEWATKKQIPHYLSLATDNELSSSEEEALTKLDAFAALSDLKKNHGKDSLFHLAWCILPDTVGFGGLLLSAPESLLVTLLSQFIDGKLLKKQKKSAIKTFLEYYELWINSKTRPNIYIESYIRGGEHFALVNARDKKYVLTNGTILGNTLEEAIAQLKKPKYTVDLEKLKEDITEKWNQ